MVVPRVVVIGGGVGGLCLLQGLRRVGVSAALYERDSSSSSRAQGYRISLKEAGAAALRACLPADLFDLAVQTSIRPATRMIFMDVQLRPRFSKPIPPSEPGPAGFGVNRLTLREILLSGIEDRCHFGKTYERYEVLDDGRIRAHFTDGSSADGDLLVGADGTNSAVRRQLLPAAIVDDLGWSIYGKTPLTDELLATTPVDLIDTFNRVIAPDDSAISIATCRPIGPIPGPLTEIPGYLSWTLKITGQRPADTRPHQLHDLARRTVADWAVGIQHIVSEADVSSTFLVDITSAQPVQPWRTPAVTLLGDAIHTMSPGRGDGANIALRDAHLLSRLLAHGPTPAAAQAEYQDQMLQYGFAAVAAARDSPFGPASVR